ncbi:MAG TPA: glycosyltransferase family 1 protein, partial [Chthoniobacteraceae bacterium]
MPAPKSGRQAAPVPIKVGFVSVVPSPYQRDLFRALSQRLEVELSVFYLEAGAYDAPWPQKPLASYEKILPGFWLPIGSGRSHINWRLPSLRRFDVVVMNTLMSVTAQLLIRTSLRHKPWIFWGERLGYRAGLHEKLAAPLNRAAGIAA